MVINLLFKPIYLFNFVIRLFCIYFIKIDQNTLI